MTPIEILLVEDNPGDVRLTRELLTQAKVLNRVTVAVDGDQAIALLRAPDPNRYRPDLILLDLNLPRKSGQEVLAEIKADPALRQIPVIVLTTSEAEADILRSYSLHANSYVVKPVDLDRFIHIIHSIETFWLTAVKLPVRGGALEQTL